MADQTHRVAFTVPNEGHPLLGARRTKPVITVAEDDVGCCDHLHSPALKGADRRSDIRNPKIKQRRRRTGLKEQPDAVDVKKQQTRRVKGRSWFRTQQVRVERRCTLEISGPLGNLDQSHFYSHSADHASRYASHLPFPATCSKVSPSTQGSQRARLETMIPETQKRSTSGGRRAIAGAALADAALILVFAAIGRDAHQRGEAVTGVLLTAWPFLAGAALGWIAARAWRTPFSIRPAGLSVWIGAVAGGMILRALTGQTVVLAFVIVALLSLGLFLVGYRLLLAGWTRIRRQGSNG